MKIVLFFAAAGRRTEGRENGSRKKCERWAASEAIPSIQSYS